MTDPKSTPPHPETLTAQAGGFVDRQTGAITPPLHPSTTFARNERYEQIGGRGYSRDDNPTYDQVESVLAGLEGAPASKVFASGMAATATVFQAMPAGSHAVVSRDMYFGTPKWLRDVATPAGLDVSFADTADLDALRAAILPGKTRLIYIETPANPTWKITDIAAVAAVAHEAGAILAVDSTAASPVLTRPIEHGADLVVHSATKYLNGHSDVIAGAIVTAEENELWARIGKIRYLAGAVLGPFEAWLLLRGMRTLFVRVRQASVSAQRIAEHFDGHPGIASVCYPGLPGFPGHEIAARQMTGGFGGMLSLRVAGGGPAALSLVKRVRVFLRATSLGGVESLIEHRHTIEKPDTEVPEDLLRLSIGLESVDDLIADLEQALAG